MKVYCAWCKDYVEEKPDCPEIPGDSHGGICDECAEAMLKEARKPPVLDAGRYIMEERR